MPTRDQTRLIEALEDHAALIDTYLSDLRAQALRHPNDQELQRRLASEIAYQIKELARVQRDRKAIEQELARSDGKGKE